jgi:cell division protein FtsW (lipid II flippase)
MEAFGERDWEGAFTSSAACPIPHSDFVFAVLGEEVGFLGVMVVLCVFVAFAVQRLSDKPRRPGIRSAKYLAFGRRQPIFFPGRSSISQSFAGLLPATGIPSLLLAWEGPLILVTSLCAGCCSTAHVGELEAKP